MSAADMDQKTIPGRVLKLVSSDLAVAAVYTLPKYADGMPLTA
jgi:hypothetical protein